MSFLYTAPLAYLAHITGHF